MATDNTDHPVSPAADDVPATPAPPITKNSKPKAKNSSALAVPIQNLKSKIKNSSPCYRRGTVARLLDEQARAAAATLEPLPDDATKKGLSPETLKEMNDKLHLL